MLKTKKKYYVKSILIKLLILIPLVIINIQIYQKVSIRLSEKTIFKEIVCAYPNLTYDKNLSRIAEEYAKDCYDNNTKLNNITIRENEDFVRLYSINAYPTKYTFKTDSDEEFVKYFLSVIKTDNYSNLDKSFNKCQYIGVGKYKEQVFLLAFYYDNGGN